jgi:DNA-binding NtrC family response regulator
VPLLVDLFCREQGASPSALPRDLVDAWRTAPWPGNVRELRNAVVRALALGELGTIEPGATTKAAVDASPGRAFEALLDALLPYEEARPRVLELFQRVYIDRVLATAQGNVQRAAALSGLALRYFQLLRARHRDPRA